MGHYRVVERILKRVSGWARLSDTAAFLKQNEIRTGIEECHRELTVCSDTFMVRQPYLTRVGNSNAFTRCHWPR
jgi:hypothetical protein